MSIVHWPPHKTKTMIQGLERVGGGLIIMPSKEVTFTVKANIALLLLTLYLSFPLYSLLYGADTCCI